MLRSACGFMVTVVVLLSFSATVEAQRDRAIPKDPKVLKSRYERKLRHPFMEQTPWIQKLTEAKAKAKDKKKPIVAYYTRSTSP